MGDKTGAWVCRASRQRAFDRAGEPTASKPAPAPLASAAGTIHAVITQQLAAEPAGLLRRGEGNTPHAHKLTQNTSK